jgi:hypothetical protein
MITTRSTLASLTLLLAFNPAQAVTVQAPMGGSGIGLMRTAELMDAGEFALTLSGTGLEYGANSSHTAASFAVAQPTFSYGLGGWGEIHLTTPYQFSSINNGNSVDGLLDPQFVLKLGNGREEGGDFATAITLFGSLATGDEKKGVVSGDYSVGGELNLSTWFGSSAIHLNLGYEQSDYKLSASGPISTEKHTVALGFDTALSDYTSLFIQSSAYKDIDSSDNSALLAVGIQHLYSDNLALQVGYGQGFSRDRSDPESLLFATLTYAPHGKNRQRYFSSVSSEDPLTVAKTNQQIIAELNEKVDELGKKVNELEDILIHVDKSAVLKLPLASPPRTEVLNTSSDPQLVDYVVKQLNGAGVSLVGVRTPTDLKEQRTWIYYRKGFAREAVTLGREIKGTQIVVKRPLPDGIDIQIVIGETLGKLGDPVPR